MDDDSSRETGSSGLHQIGVDGKYRDFTNRSPNLLKKKKQTYLTILREKVAQAKHNRSPEN